MLLLLRTPTSLRLQFLWFDNFIKTENLLFSIKELSQKNVTNINELFKENRNLKPENDFKK